MKIILIFEIALICGVFIFFSTYDFGGDSGNSSGVKKRTDFSYSLNKANKNAELAYGAVREYFDETFHIEDSIAHGEFIGANTTEAISWFKNPENTSVVNAYLAKLKV